MLRIAGDRADAFGSAAPLSVAIRARLQVPVMRICPSIPNARHNPPAKASEPQAVCFATVRAPDRRKAFRMRSFSGKIALTWGKLTVSRFLTAEGRKWEFAHDFRPARPG
jgi:hypothetical protein